MGSERLKEITLDIIELEDPLAVTMYISNLSESDIRLFLNYIKSSTYKDLNLYSAALAFSFDYLNSIGCPIPDNKMVKPNKSKVSL